MTGSIEEKRREFRYPYRQPVTYVGHVSTPGHPPQEVSFRGVIVDLSNSGMGIETRGASLLEVGAFVRTWIPLATIPASIPMLAQVQWVREKSSGTSQLAGLKFVS